MDQITSSKFPFSAQENTPLSFVRTSTWEKDQSLLEENSSPNVKDTEFKLWNYGVRLPTTDPSSTLVGKWQELSDQESNSYSCLDFENPTTAQNAVTDTATGMDDLISANLMLPETIGKILPDQAKYAAYAQDGATGFVVGLTNEQQQVLWQQMAFEQMQSLADIAEKNCIRNITCKPLVMHNLLIEVLAQHQEVTDMELAIIVPNELLWEESLSELALRLFRYTLSAMSDDEVRFKGKREAGFNELVALDYCRLSQLVYNPFVSKLKESVSSSLSQYIAQLKKRGHFAVDREPSKNELESLKIVPQCDVRGVGWNGSTKAWVASWLPMRSHKRVCATFSTRKFGFHVAMKMAICQRVRSELRIYGQRRYPSALEFVAHMTQSPPIEDPYSISYMLQNN